MTLSPFFTRSPGTGDWAHTSLTLAVSEYCGWAMGTRPRSCSVFCASSSGLRTSGSGNTCSTGPPSFFDTWRTTSTVPTIRMAASSASPATSQPVRRGGSLK